MAGTAGKDDRAAPGARPTTGFAAASSLIYPALALAMLIGLIASGSFLGR